MRIIDVCDINPKTQAIDNSIEVSFVAMSDVSEDGKINTGIIRQYREVKKGFTCFREGDVLFAKITPCMENGKGALALGLKNGIGCGSTEFHVLRPNTEVIQGKWLYYLTSWSAFRKDAERHMTGSAGQKRVPKAFLEKYELQIPTLSEQSFQAEVLDRTKAVIELRKRELQNLDDLIKARFVEMFGDPVHNTANLPVLPMTEVCEIIDGDRGKNYPKQEDFFNEEYCLFLNAKNVTNHGFDFSECMFVTKEKDESLRKGKLKRGDVVLTTRGTLGNLAFYTDAVPYENVRINSGMVILRMNKQIIDEGFFIEQFRMQVDDIKKTIASGSAQPQLPISIMNKIFVIMPDINEQKLFSNFASQVDKSKVAVQKALDETQTLFDSLMQEYFG